MALLSFQIIIIFWLLKYACLYDSYSGDISPYVKTRVNNLDSRVQVVSNPDAAERTKSAYLGASFKKLPQHCLKVQCSYTCFNGRQKEIVSDIQYAISISNHSESCDVIDELRLYNYEFINATVGIGFLSTFGDKVKNIYIAISNVTAIENGAFGEGIFNKIILEDLRLKDITNGIFRNISEDLKGIYITQREEPVQYIYPSFLDSVKFQIEHLVIRVGLECVRNVTAHDPVMGLLAFVDFSYNNFSSQLLEDTFSKLTMVERFVLSNSNIMYLPQYIFQGMEYLEYLDISHNKLKTISSSVFGSRTIAQNVRIIANDNVWHCDCTLQYEMNTIFASSKLPMYCWSPEAFKNCSVFDERYCHSNDTEESYETDSTLGATITSQNSTMKTTESPIHIPTLPTPATVPPNEVVALECLAQNQTGTKAQENIRQNLWWPQINFFPKTHGSLTVQITVELEDLNGSKFGIVWFSKTTKEYYMMELFPDEYGFGCYFTMPLRTIVTNLVPNVAYTFCLIDSNQNSVSPFSCKSVHISGNIEVYYFSWMSEHIRSKGISWMILGIVTFLFLGIIFMFLVLKQKPDWLRGSKRVMKPKSSSGNIVVLPRGNTVQNLERQEAVISGSKPKRLLSCISRNNSSESIPSTQSYMIANLYESVPAYMTLDEVCISVEKGSHKSTFVEDTQIYQLSKRLSSDPLPAVPRKYM